MKKREGFYKDLQELTENKEEMLENEEISLSEYYKIEEYNAEKHHRP